MNFLNFRVSNTVISEWVRKKTVFDRWYLKLNVRKKTGHFLPTPLSRDWKGANGQKIILKRNGYANLFKTGKTFQTTFWQVASSEYNTLGLKPLDKKIEIWNVEITGWAMGYPKGWVMDVFKK